MASTACSGQVKIDAEDIGIARIDLPARISVRIGNDLGSALVNPNGSLNLGPD